MAANLGSNELTLMTTFQVPQTNTWFHKKLISSNSHYIHLFFFIINTCTCYFLTVGIKLPQWCITATINAVNASRVSANLQTQKWTWYIS